jgi:hypothetical protein
MASNWNKFDTTGKVRDCSSQWLENFKFSNLHGSPHFVIPSHIYSTLPFRAWKCKFELASWSFWIKKLGPGPFEKHTPIRCTPYKTKRFPELFTVRPFPTPWPIFVKVSSQVHSTISHHPVEYRRQVQSQYLFTGAEWFCVNESAQNHGPMLQQRQICGPLYSKWIVNVSRGQVRYFLCVPLGEKIVLWIRQPEPFRKQWSGALCVFSGWIFNKQCPTQHIHLDKQAQVNPEQFGATRHQCNKNSTTKLRLDK